MKDVYFFAGQQIPLDDAPFLAGREEVFCGFGDGGRCYGEAVALCGECGLGWGGKVEGVCDEEVDLARVLEDVLF